MKFIIQIQSVKYVHILKFQKFKQPPNTSSTTQFSQPNTDPQISNTHFIISTKGKYLLVLAYRECNKIKKKIAKNISIYKDLMAFR